VIEKPVNGPRAVRHARTKARILDTAWQLAAAEGLAGISLRRLAARVDLTQPALYSYFASKDGLYDAMFADGWAHLLAAMDEVDAAPRPKARLAAVQHWVRFFIDWSEANPERFQLLFQRPVPGFQPTAESFALAIEFDNRLDQAMSSVGIADHDSVELLGALAIGLVTLQLSNEPGGTTWSGTADRCVALFWTGLQAERRRAIRS